MDNRDDFCINFAGWTHDHTLLDSAGGSEIDQDEQNRTGCSTIAILRQHPMYDCLVLVKKYRSCLDGPALEFPSSVLTTSGSQADVRDENTAETPAAPSSRAASCSRARLVSRFLDGDDPIYQGCQGSASALAEGDEQTSPSPTRHLAFPFVAQTDDRGHQCELVHVPINGLLDRLKNYTETGVAVDSRVYAFAMGLKTAERILTNVSTKELQEAPAQPTKGGRVKMIA